MLFSLLDETNDSIFPATIFNDWAVSKTFLIIFKNEEVELDDQFNFKLSVIVDAQNVKENENVSSSSSFSFRFVSFRSTIILTEWIYNCLSSCFSWKKTFRKKNLKFSFENVFLQRKNETKHLDLVRRNCPKCNNCVVAALNCILILVWVFTHIFQFSSIIFIYQH